MAQITLFVSRWCVQCERAVALLERHGVPYEVVDVSTPDACCRLHELTGGSSVPQAVVGGRPIGGIEALAAYLAAGSAAAPMTGAERSAIVAG